MVAIELSLSQTTLQSLYTPTDTYNTNSIVRNFWKYGVSKGVAESPTIFVNGAPLVAAPYNVDGWISLLDAVYAEKFIKTTPDVPAGAVKTVSAIALVMSLYTLI